MTTTLPLPPARAIALLGLLASNYGCEKLPAAPELPNQRPVTTFAYTPVAPIYAGETGVLFSALGTHDPDGEVVAYEWNFGDGSPLETSTEPVIRHVFPDTPSRCLHVTYGVMLVAIDEKDGRGVDSRNVTVTELPDPGSLQCGAR